MFLNTLNNKLIAIWIGLKNSEMAVLVVDSFAFLGPLCNRFWTTITINLEGEIISLESLLIIHVIAAWLG